MRRPVTLRVSIRILKSVKPDVALIPSIEPHPFFDQLGVQQQTWKRSNNAHSASYYVTGLRMLIQFRRHILDHKGSCANNYKPG